MPDAITDTEQQAIERYLAEHGATRPEPGVIRDDPGLTWRRGALKWRRRREAKRGTAIERTKSVRARYNRRATELEGVMRKALALGWLAVFVLIFAGIWITAGIQGELFDQFDRAATNPNQNMAAHSRTRSH